MSVSQRRAAARKMRGKKPPKFKDRVPVAPKDRIKGRAGKK